MHISRGILELLFVSFFAMHQNMSPHKTGLALGAFVGGVHVLWSILVALGLAQMLVSFILWAHMITLVYVINDFNLAAALALIVVTALVGYIVGNVFARVWNRMHRA